MEVKRLDVAYMGIICVSEQLSESSHKIVSIDLCTWMQMFFLFFGCFFYFQPYVFQLEVFFIPVPPFFLSVGTRENKSSIVFLLFILNYNHNITQLFFFIYFNRVNGLHHSAGRT